MALFNDGDKPAVILDTNILIYSASEPFDLAHQLMIMGFTRVLVPSSVLWELEAICQGKSRKLAKFAKLALRIATAFERIDLQPAKPSVDEEIINVAKTEGHMVATSDGAMRRRLRATGITVLYLKDGRLTNEGEV
jgi:rRNA-processing protein FCF1